MNPSRNALGAACLLLGCGTAASAGSDAAERERIANERAVIETRYAEERLACQKNFVVTSCVDAARRREREELGRLRREEALLDEAQRRQRAADRRAAIQAKVDGVLVAVVLAEVRDLDCGGHADDASRARG